MELSMPSDLKFSEIKRLLEDHGWYFDRASGSHHVFKGKGRKPLSIPVHSNRVKYVYKREIDKAIEELRKGGKP